MAQCTPEHVEEMLSLVRKGRRESLLPEPEQIWWLATQITSCMHEEDPDLDETPIIGAEIKKAQSILVRLNCILENVKKRVEDHKLSLESGAIAGEPSHRDYFASEAAGAGLYINKLQSFQVVLGDIQQTFAPSEVRIDRWQRHAARIYRAFNGTVPCEGKQDWGIGADGPAAHFVQLALSLIYQFVKSVKQPSWQPPSLSNIEMSLRQSRGRIPLSLPQKKARKKNI